jgi:hypothetical protein
VFDLVATLWNAVADAPAAQLAPRRGVAIRLVGQQILGSMTALGEGVEQGHQARVVAGLAG